MGPYRMDPHQDKLEYITYICLYGQPVPNVSNNFTAIFIDEVYVHSLKSKLLRLQSKTLYKGQM